MKSRTSGSWLGLMALPLLVVLLVILVIHSHMVDAQEAVDSKARLAAANSHVAEMVARATYRQYQGDLKPVVVWSGAGATILHSGYWHREKKFGPDTYNWDVLARTPSGKFFSVNVEVSEDANCAPAEIAECSFAEDFRPIPASELKAVVFALKDAKLYRQLFNEDMPPLEVPA